MIVGILQFELHIHGAESLKDKRRVISSVRDRLHREHLVSVAEVAAQDILNLAVMGLAVVGSDGGHIGRTLDAITAKLRALGDAELGLTSRRLIHGHEAQELSEEEARDDGLAAEMLSRAEEMLEDTSKGKDAR